MRATQWIKQARDAGWRVASSRDGILTMCCAYQGCTGSHALSLSNLGPIPGPCALKHVGQYGAAAYALYTDLVDDLRRRRRALGLSIEDLNDAAGMADGHLNKLESFARTAQFPTLQLWAETLGTQITLKPIPLPPATLRAIERRKANPYAANQVRTKRPIISAKALSHE